MTDTTRPPTASEGGGASHRTPQGEDSGERRRRRRRRSRRPAGNHQNKTQNNAHNKSENKTSVEGGQSGSGSGAAASASSEQKAQNNGEQGQQRRSRRRRGRRRSSSSSATGSTTNSTNNNASSTSASGSGSGSGSGSATKSGKSSTAQQKGSQKNTQNRKRNSRGGQSRNSRNSANRKRQYNASPRMETRDETSAGGLVVSGMAEAVRPDNSVDLSRIYVALIGRLDRRGRLLWSMPKGHVEPGEHEWQTAEREVWEETGIYGEAFSTLGTIDYWFVSDGVRIHKTVHHNLLRFVDGELNDEDPEVTEVSWVPVDQLIEHLAYADERKLARLAFDQMPELARKEHEAGRATPR
ncbi:NUDIX hydrolase [Corynebacterium lubricantis]|uniref:NUDIX hydrolase n=1 Tax=Corynebacterium lubricantis TaxID=541095 RepID=UPI000A044D49|nr:NUDIX hydrolase [Corynebacterium lubricantis]